MTKSIATPAAAEDPAQHLMLLDGLRGLAAIAVVVLHYSNFFLIQSAAQLQPGWQSREPGAEWLSLFYIHGTYAVNVFWMISGFVFAYVYCGKSLGTREFVAHRIARLYPLHLLTLLVVAGLQMAAVWKLGYGLISPHNDLRHFLEHVFFVSGWGIDKYTQFNFPIWSVSVELLVYAGFWGLRGWLDQRGPLAALMVAMIAGMLLLLGQKWLAIGCTYYFFIGVALAQWWRAGAQRAVRIASVGLMLAGLWLLQSSNEATSIGLGLPAFFGGVILVLVSAERIAGRLARRIAQWLGEATYSVYLWHVPIQLTAILLLADHADIAALASHWWFLGLWLASVMIVARFSYRHFEAPARRVVRRFLLQPRKRGDTSAAFA